MDKDLGVRMGTAENMAGRCKFSTQLFVIINFTIENDLDFTIFVGHRLLAAGNINHGQTSVTKPDLVCGIAEYSVAIGATMTQGISHRSDIFSTARSGPTRYPTQLSPGPKFIVLFTT